MLRTGTLALLLAALASASPAAQMQGVIADWNCVKTMVKNGRAKTLKQNQNCSMMKSYSREGYGLITDDKHYYKLDDAGRNWALKLLKDTTDKDNLRVIVDGDVQGDTIHVTNMSEL
jgi:hypothetical protein